MPLDAPITISQQAKNLQAVLGDWASQHGGAAEVASDLKNFWVQSGTNNDQPRILIVYTGETARGSFEKRSALDRVDRTWNVGVFRGRGFSAQRGDSLTKNVVNAIPFYDVVEQIRDMLRSILNISEEFPVEFLNIKPLSQGTQIVDAYVIEFVTANDIPNIYTDTFITPDPNPQSEGFDPEVPTDLNIIWHEPPDAVNYGLEWTVTRAPLVAFNVYFSNVSGGPYAVITVPAASGTIAYTWVTDVDNPLTPPSGSHEDMYLVVEFDDGNGSTASSTEYHGVYSPS